MAQCVSRKKLLLSENRNKDCILNHDSGQKSRHDIRHDMEHDFGDDISHGIDHDNGHEIRHTAGIALDMKLGMTRG